jgi:LssY C-terminus
MKRLFVAPRHRYLAIPAAIISIYVLVSYLVLPATWARVEHEPGLSKRAMVTSTAQGIPGDPINVGLIGTKEEVVSAFHAAGWHPADPVTLRTSVEIKRSRQSTLFRRPARGPGVRTA